MANWGAGAGGAASGAGTGAAIGSEILPGWGTAIGAVAGGLFGGLSGLFGGGDDDAIQQQIAMWRAAIAKMQNDPTEAAALAQLQGLTTEGLTDQERSEMLSAALGAGNLAHSRESAIALNANARGGGATTSGMSSANQDLAAQGAANQYAQSAQQAAGNASQRRTAAVQAYNQELDRRQQLLLVAQNGLTGALNGEQNYNEAQSEALMQNLAAGGSNALAAFKLAKKPAGASAVATPSSSAISGLKINPTGPMFTNPDQMSSINSYFYGAGDGGF